MLRYLQSSSFVSFPSGYGSEVAVSGATSFCLRLRPLKDLARAVERLVFPLRFTSREDFSPGSYFAELCGCFQPTVSDRRDSLALLMRIY
jgi:hypothetical protein